MTEQTKKEFVEKLTHLINYFSLENESSTPDFILAEYLVDCLINYNKAVSTRDKWRGIKSFEEQLLGH